MNNKEEDEYFCSSVQIKVTYLIHKSSALVHREHDARPGKMRDARSLPLRLRQSSDGRLRPRARAPHRTQRDGADSARESENAANQDRAGASVVRRLSFPQPLSSAALPMLGYGCTLSPNGPPRQHGKMSRERSADPLCLCRCLRRI